MKLFPGTSKEAGGGGGVLGGVVGPLDLRVGLEKVLYRILGGGCKLGLPQSFIPDAALPEMWPGAGGGPRGCGQGASPWPPADVPASY